MNIACTSCSARYGVADDKINGKRVRITCKRCGTVLVVDGTNTPATVSASTSIAPTAPAAGRRPSATPEPSKSVAPAPTPAFLVTFPDERQERADVAQIVRFHRAGQLGPETLVWREGMAEWANPWDVEDIASAFRRMGYTRPTPKPAAPPVDDLSDDEATQIGRSSPYTAPLFGDDETTSVVDSVRQPQSGGMAPGSSPVTADDDMPTRVGRAPTASAGRTSKMNPELRTTRREPVVERRARKESVRPEQGVTRGSDPVKRAGRRAELPPRGDLFARQAQAGSEEEEARARVAAADALAAAEAQALADANAPRLTGARNDTSVLFSLDSLLKKEQAPAPAPVRSRAAKQDESLLVDSGNSLQMTGGSFSPSLAAPDFTAPVSAAPAAPVFAPDTSFDMPQPKGSRTWLVATLVGVVALLGGFVFASGGVAPALSKVGLAPAPTPAPSIPTAPATTADKPAAPEATNAATATPEPSASASTSASAAASSATPPATVAAAPTPAAPRAPTTRPSEPARPQPASPTPEPAAPEPEPESPSSGAAFDTGAAKTVLTAAAANASSCKQADGPTGSGRVSITYAPSGRPTSVAVTGDVAGSAVGSCVAKLFRQTRVPAFSGDPVTVAKGFSIE